MRERTEKVRSLCVFLRGGPAANSLRTRYRLDGLQGGQLDQNCGELFKLQFTALSPEMKNLKLKVENREVLP